MTLKVGDVIRYRYQYALEYRILTTPDGGGIIKTKPPVGTTHVIQGAWKREVFIPKKIVKVKP